MKIAQKSSFASVLATTFIVAACGGGGGDGGSGAPSQTAPTLAITTANRDLVSHDAVAGVMSLAATTSIPLGSPTSVSSRMSVQRWRMASSWSGRMAGSALDHLRFGLPAAGRQQILAVTPPYTQACLVSGSTTTTVDDRDNSGDLSVGDFGTVVFNNCRDTATETVNGTATLLISGLDSTYLGAHVTATKMSTVTAGHSLIIDGSMLMEVSTADAVLTKIKTTAEGPVQATISTHVPFADTVTLEAGFVIEETIDLSIAPPAGAGAPGQTLTTLSGRMHSAGAGGTFDVTTLGGAPITRYHADDYPSAGILKVTGASGLLVLTTTSVSSVVLDLDWNDDGRYETSEQKTWDWLI